jgi:hypothetical protein
VRQKRFKRHQWLLQHRLLLHILLDQAQLHVVKRMLLLVMSNNLMHELLLQEKSKTIPRIKASQKH